LKAAADLAGYNINRKSNLVMLPKDAKAAAKTFDGKPKGADKLLEHRGGHNQGGEVGDNYQNHVRDKLKKLDDEYRASVASGNPWSPEELLDAVKKFESEIENDLLTGKSPPLCKDCKSGGI